MAPLITRLRAIVVVALSSGQRLASPAHLHPECWVLALTPQLCCVPPDGRPECFPSSEPVFNYAYCCEKSDDEKRSELTNGGWLDTRYFRSVIGPEHLTLRGDPGYVPPPLPTQDLMMVASQPFVAQWLDVSAEQLGALMGDSNVPCGLIFDALLNIAHVFKSNAIVTLEDAFKRQEAFLVVASLGRSTAVDLCESPYYRAIMTSLMMAHRCTMNVIEFISMVQLAHGWRCFFLHLRTIFGRIISASKDLSTAYLRINFAVAFQGRFDTHTESTEVVRFLKPTWEIYDKLAEIVGHLTEMMTIFQDGTTPESILAARGVHSSQSLSGAFSEMNVLKRRMGGGWHLDHGLVASLIRFWPPNPAGEGRMTIGDFGAGAGHYCSFLNRTGSYDCLAFDGAHEIDKQTDGRVTFLRLDKPFDLGRQFDWVMSFECAEHLPPGAAETFVENLRRHTLRGAVVSWSQHHSDDVHPGALPWPGVLRLMEAHGFWEDMEASKLMLPVLSWIVGAVHVLRTA